MAHNQWKSYQENEAGSLTSLPKNWNVKDSTSGKSCCNAATEDMIENFSMAYIETLTSADHRVNFVQ